MSDLSVKFFVVPGGVKPERKTEGAAGFDVCLRSIISAHEQDRLNPHLRKTLFDFSIKSGTCASNVHHLDGGLVWRIFPGEMVLVSVGVVLEMPSSIFCWVVPRSSLWFKHSLQITGSPSVIDSDFRGEPSLLVHNFGTEPFDLKKGMRLAQLVFQEVLIPRMVEVEGYDQLNQTKRGANDFGSTGLFG